MRSRVVLVAAAVAAVALLGSTSGRAAPNCTTAGTEVLCGGRVVPEAMQSTTFQQFDGPVESLAGTLAAIEAIAPDIIDVVEIGRSHDDRPILVVRVTDESVTEQKKQVAISLSVHGLEPAAREGGLRYIEDLARWHVGDPHHPLWAGDLSFPLSTVLAETETYIGFLNPDGWAAGDHDAGPDAGPGFVRGNGRGADLNRDFPTLGWMTRGSGRGIALSEPESRAWHALVTGLPNLTTAADIHGELTSVNNAFSDLMWPAGQWDPKRQAQELQLAQHMIRTVERKFEDDGVVLDDLFGPAVGQRPANVATAYDVVGYDDSGFMGDWFASLGAVEIDVENFLSHQVPNNVWIGALEQAHIAAVRGNMEAIITEALITDEVAPALDLGSVAYVFDPSVVTSDDGTEFALAAGETQKPYSVTRMRYFEDLGSAAGTPLAPLTVEEIADTDLSQYDSIVVSDMEVDADVVAALQAFAEGGGQLVLTDRSVRLLDDLGIVTEGDLRIQRTNAGHVDFGERTHAWEAGLFGEPSQTYYEVPLGFQPTNSAPHHAVTRSAWEAAGGVTVGTVGSELAVLGEVAVGDGSVAIFGAILPQPIEELVLENGTVREVPHPEGLADYAVTIAGGHVLHQILAYTRV